MQASDMKQIIFSALAIVGMFFFNSCERHTWEDSAEGKKDGTKRLFPKPAESHDAHKGHGHDVDGKKDDHSNHDHTKKDGHGHAESAH